MNLRKWIPRVVVVGLGLFVVIQVVPYGRNHVNPKATEEVKWPDARTKDLARRACMDCHSNETTWPWYSHVAPMSWLIYRDVIQGRKRVNFSEWDAANPGSDNTVEMIERGDMPFKPYLILHPEARLTDGEKKELIAGLQKIIDGADDGEKKSEAKKD